MYALKYPTLAQKYQFLTFEVIMETLATRFPKLFNFSALENIAIENKCDESSYFCFFNALMRPLCDESLRSRWFTVDEICNGIYILLNSYDYTRSHFIEKFVFASKPYMPCGLGYLEKVMTGEVSETEPVTLIDMLRVVNGLVHSMRRTKQHPIPIFAVYELNSFPDRLDTTKIDVLVLNVNLDPKDTPKWSIVDLRDKNNPQVYCETPLFEQEKNILQQKLKIDFQPVLGSHDKTNFLASTGYSAVAWLDEKITKTGGMEISSDFNSALVNYLRIQFGGCEDHTKKGLVYRCQSPQEYNDYCVSAFKSLNACHRRSDRRQKGTLALEDCTEFDFLEKTIITHASVHEIEHYLNGYLFVRLASIACLPQLQDQFNRTLEKPHALFDIMKFICSGSSDGLTAFQKYQYQAMRSNLPGMLETFKSLERNLLEESDEEVKLTIPPDISGHENIFVSKEGPRDVLEIPYHTLWVTPDAVYWHAYDGMRSATLNDLDENTKVSIQEALLSSKRGEKVTFTHIDSNWLISSVTGSSGLNNMDERNFRKRYKALSKDKYDVNHLCVLQPKKSTSLYQEHFDEHDLATSLVLILFRTKAKKRKLTLHLPLIDPDQASRYKVENQSNILKEREIDLIAHMVDSNPFLTKLTINEDNESLVKLKKKLTPALARNRWLAYNNYLPPLMDDYWQRVARYWLIYLYEHKEILSHHPMNNILQECASEMGIAGLNAVLELMKDDENTQILKTIYGHQLPAFYFYLSKDSGNEAETENRSCMDLFKEHLSSKHSFPFSEVVIAYDSRYKQDYLTLIGHLNKRKIDKIQFTNIGSDMPDLTELLNILSLEASSKRWTSLIVIPDLQNPTKDQLHLLPLYNPLNNIILRNIRQEKGRALADDIRLNSHMDLKPLATEDAKEISKQQEVYFHEGAPEMWAFSRGGAKLQMQHETRHETQNQIQKYHEHQHELLHAQQDEIIADELVTYENIDKLLGNYYQELKKEKYQDQLDSKYRPLANPNETELQGFFHTWINSPPSVKAPFVIHSMTQEAAKMLLRHSTRLASGLQLKNLPRGFYTQRSKDDELILCYNPEFGFAKGSIPTLLTVDLSVSPPVPERWEGDAKILLTEDSSQGDTIELQQLFDQLQPTAKEDITEANIKLAQTIFFSPLSDDSDREWAMKNIHTSETLRAMGQVFYRNGSDCVGLLIRKFRQIETVLGDRILQIILSQTHNYNTYLTVNFFTTMDDMIQQFTSQESDSEPHRKAWLSICEKHFSRQWENLDTLWKGFDYFRKELEAMELKLLGNEFDKLPPQNMLVSLDRILFSLYALPTQQAKQGFLQSLSRLDLTHSGVHYAIQYDDFSRFDGDLALTHFEKGIPTYAVNLSQIKDWENMEPLYIKRLLASTCFSEGDYQELMKEAISPYQLVWLLYVQSEHLSLHKAFKDIQQLDSQFVQDMAQHIYHAIHRKHRPHLQLSLEGLKHCASHWNQLKGLLTNYPDGNFLEAVSTFFKSDANIEKILTIEKNLPKKRQCPEDIYRELCKLAALFGVSEQQPLGEFIRCTSDLPRAALHELKQLITYLYTVDYQASREKLWQSDNWQMFLACIRDMKRLPQDRATLGEKFIEALQKRGIKFTRDKMTRQLTQEDYPKQLHLFSDHKALLWEFLKTHIRVPADQEIASLLEPFMSFCQQLYQNPTLNKLEPLLSIFTQVKQEKVWHIQYFMSMLKALKPENDRNDFPMGMLRALLLDESMKDNPLSGAKLPEQFPETLTTGLKTILNTSFTHPHKAVLCSLFLKAHGAGLGVEVLTQTINLLNLPLSQGALQNQILAMLSAREPDKLIDQINELSNVMGQVTNPKTVAIWINTLSKNNKRDRDLFLEVSEHYSDKAAHVLPILAWSSLQPNGRDSELYDYERNHKTRKLLNLLIHLDPTELNDLSLYYPAQPAPSEKELIRLLKKSANEGKALKEVLAEFDQDPYQRIRADYKKVAHTRQADLERMFAKTRITDGSTKRLLNADEIAKLSVLFAELKAYERGYGQVSTGRGYKSISQMSQKELAEAFKTACRAQKNQSLIYALLFEALARSHGNKYPHLAQQFALIANDVCITTDARVLRLSTGEGKSHFVALRAAIHAASGKKVDICTAKTSLASRDEADYKDFFKYLGLNTQYLDTHTRRENYDNAQIIYTTFSDLSLFCDNQAFYGQPVEMDSEERIGLFDEVDFIRFDEGTKTEYNYARPLAYTPKQLNWFYQAVNEFYKTAVLTPPIDRAMILRFARFLSERATGNIQRETWVETLCRDGEQLAYWLQSAYEAHGLKKGSDFAIQEREVKIGQTTYLLKEIIPLTLDNQKMFKATFSAGVQQLLAVGLNTEAKARGETPNYYVPHESEIISSQVAPHLMPRWKHWEGFTGTLSAEQAKLLNAEKSTQVLEVPTNNPDRREWHDAKFCKNEEEQLHLLIVKVRESLEMKQSMLFACEDDKQVHYLQEKLLPHLTPDEQKHFIFYTNDDQKNTDEIFDKKRIQEQWQKGQKTQGVGLVASCFGRGDNVDVDVVFLLKVRDVNDLHQKAGRTARNGQRGEVYQYYLSHDLQKEEQLQRRKLIAALPNSDKILSLLDERLSHVGGKSEDEKCFHRLLLLNQYVFTVQNTANQGYRQAKAQLSAFGMQLIGQTTRVKRKEVTDQVSRALKAIDKCWLNLSGITEFSSMDKVRRIEQVVCQQVQLLRERYPTELAFALTPYQELPFDELLQKEKEIEETQLTQDLAGLGAKIASISIRPHVENSRCLVDVITDSDIIQQLAAKPEVLHQFMGHAASFYSEKEWVEALIALSQGQELKVGVPFYRLEDPAPLSPEQRDELLKLTTETFAEEHRATTWQSINKALKTHPDTYDSIIRPISRLLLAFSLEKEQADFLYNTIKLINRFQVDEINRLAALIKKISDSGEEKNICKMLPNIWEKLVNPNVNNTAIAEVLKNCVEETSITKGIKKLDVFTYFLPECVLTPKQLNDLFSLHHYLKPNTERNCLDELKTLIQLKDAEKNAAFFSVDKLIQDYSTFLTRLFSKELKAQLIAGKNKLWYLHFLKEFPKLKPKIDEVIKSPSLDLALLIQELNPERFTQEASIETLLRIISETSDPSSDLTFRKCCGALKYLEQEEYNIKNMAALDPKRLAIVLEVIADNKEKMNSIKKGDLGEIVDALLVYTANSSIGSSRLKLMTKLLLQAAMVNGQLTLGQLSAGVNRFRDTKIFPDESLATLCSLFEEKKLKPETALFNKTANYLHKMPAENRDAACEVIHDFYAYVTTKGNENKQLPDTSVRTSKGKRLSLVKLLISNDFQTDTVTELYKWDNIQNEKALEEVLRHYSDKNAQLLPGLPKPALKHCKYYKEDQQCKLLFIADRLAKVHEGQKEVKYHSPTARKADFCDAIETILENYSATWLTQSRSRGEVFSAFQDNINALLAKDKTITVYEKVFNLVHEEQKKVLEQDNKENEGRFFKLHRGGSSNYYITLNQLSYLSLKYWATNPKTIQSFSNYLIKYEENLEFTLDNFKKAFKNYYPSLKTKGLFAHSKALQDLNNYLQRITTSNDIKDVTKITNLNLGLQDALPHLPGHLKTFALEVTMRSGGWLHHLNAMKNNENNLVTS